MLRLSRRFNDRVVIHDECRRKTKHYCECPCSAVFRATQYATDNRGRKKAGAKRGIRRLNVMDIITCYCNIYCLFFCQFLGSLVRIQYPLWRSANACHRMSSKLRGNLSDSCFARPNCGLFSIV